MSSGNASHVEGPDQRVNSSTLAELSLQECYRRDIMVCTATVRRQQEYSMNVRAFFERDVTLRERSNAIRARHACETRSTYDIIGHYVL